MRVISTKEREYKELYNQLCKKIIICIQLTPKASRCILAITRTENCLCVFQFLVAPDRPFFFDVLQEQQPPGETYQEPCHYVEAHEGCACSWGKQQHPCSISDIYLVLPWRVYSMDWCIYKQSPCPYTPTYAPTQNASEFFLHCSYLQAEIGLF